MLTIAFDRDDSQAAADEWHCNCGPAALAAILGKGPNDVRQACESVGFEAKRYMSPTMMKSAIPLAGGRIKRERAIRRDSGRLMFPELGLARIQFTGPWTKEGSNPKWAYRQTHWVASWRQGRDCSIFDINGGVRSYADWVEEIVTLIIANIERADGGWYVTHSWEIVRSVEQHT